MKETYARSYRELYECHWWWRARERFLVDQLRRELKPGTAGRVLDVGCGDGLFFEKLSEFGEVDGVELDRDVIRSAAQHSRRIHVGPFDQTFSPNYRYSAILMLDVLEHLHDPANALRHALALLEADGKLIVTVPAFNLLWTNHDDINEHLYTRRIVGFGIQAGTVDGRTLCRMFNHAIRGRSRPTRLSSDHDPLYRFHHWRANLRVLQVTEVKSVPSVPLSHPFVERLIGTRRRECVDQLLFWSASDLADTLVAFQDFYNAHRAHASLDGRTPVPIRKDVARLDRYRWDAHCRGLYQTPIAA